MRKSYVFVLLILVSTATTYAQIRIGATAGFQATTHTPEDLSAKNSLKASYFAGAMFSLPLSESISLRPQVLYSRKGVQTTVLGVFDANLALNYLEIPVQLVYSARSPTGWLNFGAGLYYAYGFSDKAVITSNGQTYTATDNFGSGSDQFRRSDVGARLSIDYELESGLTFGAFYAPGLTDINTVTASGNNTTHNSALGVSVGYWFKKR